MLTDPGTPHHPLRVGILLDGFLQPAWIEEALKEIRASGQLQLALIVLDATPTEADSPARKTRGLFGKIVHWARSWRHAAYWAYLKLDDRLWPAQDDLFRLVDLSEFLDGIPTISVNTIRKKFSDWFPDESVEAILAHELDVAQRFGFRILKGRSLAIARHGVWSFHHGDYLAYRGGPAGLWEVLDGTRRTGLLLQRLTEDLDDGAPIASVLSRTDLRSVTLNRRHYYALGPKLLARELVRLQRNGPAASARDWSCYSAPMFVDPRPSDMMTLGSRLVARTVQGSIGRLKEAEHAGISCTFRSDAGGTPHGALYRARPLPKPDHVQWLDPCAGVIGGERFILVSEKGGGGPARLMSMPLDGKTVRCPGLPIYAETGGDVRSPVPFSWQGTPHVYLTVDGEPGIRLLRCLRWPDYWELADTILPHGQARSIAIAEIDGTWWLFVGEPSAPGRSADLLNLYHAVSPLGPWLPHPLNPVRLGDDGVCPAGQPFAFAGHWYRPARDLTVEDGCCLAMMRIERLDQDGYSESRSGLLRPEPRLGIAGVTSISAIDGLTVFGTRRTRWRKPWGPAAPPLAD